MPDEPIYPQPEPEGDEQNTDYSVPADTEGVDDDSRAVG